MKWIEQRNDITYIFSKEILDSGKAKEDDAVFLDKLESYQDDNLIVKAYGSTDIGGSFYIETNGKAIFHAAATSTMLRDSVWDWLM